MSGLVTRTLVVMARRGGKGGAAVALRADLWRSGVRAGADGAVEIPGREEVYRELWERAARACGAAVDDLGDGFLALSRDDRRVVVRNGQVPLDDPVMLQLAAHKAVAARMLREAGLVVPEQQAYTIHDLAPARLFVAAHSGPCVVKPASGTGAGMGVTCGVETDDELARASVRAARWGRALVVEQQAEGDEYRVLVLDGRVLGAVVRRPPRVVGDGRSTVAELVARENERRVAARGRAGLWRLALDLDAVFALARQGWSPRSKPDAGVEVAIGATANENGPDDNETVDPPEAVRRAAVAAAGAFGLRLAAVELRSAEAVIVEVNGTPGLHYHAQVADPSTAVDVAGPILETLLAQEQRP